MTKFSLLNSQYVKERGGFEAIVMADTGVSKKRYDCYLPAQEDASDRSVIKGLLEDAKRKHQLATEQLVAGFPMSPNQVRYMRSA